MRVNGVLIHLQAEHVFEAFATPPAGIGRRPRTPPAVGHLLVVGGHGIPIGPGDRTGHNVPHFDKVRTRVSAHSDMVGADSPST